MVYGTKEISTGDRRSPSMVKLETVYLHIDDIPHLSLDELYQFRSEVNQVILEDNCHREFILWLKAMLTAAIEEKEYRNT